MGLHDDIKNFWDGMSKGSAEQRAMYRKDVGEYMEKLSGDTWKENPVDESKEGLAELDNNTLSSQIEQVYSAQKDFILETTKLSIEQQKHQGRISDLEAYVKKLQEAGDIREQISVFSPDKVREQIEDSEQDIEHGKYSVFYPDKERVEEPVVEIRRCPACGAEGTRTSTGLSDCPTNDCHVNTYW